MKDKFLQILFGINLLWTIFLFTTGYQTNLSKQYVVITKKFDKYYYWDNQIKETIIYNSLDEAMNTLSQKGYRFDQSVQVGEGVIKTVMSK